MSLFYHDSLFSQEVYYTELVHFFLRQDAQRYVTVAQAVHFPQIVNGLMFQYQLAIAVKLARSAKAWIVPIFSPPFVGEWW